MAREVVRIDAYRAAEELPSIIELREQMNVFKPFAYVVGALTGRHLGREASQIERQLDHLVRLIDSFYELLGERNWVLHGLLKTELIETMLDQDSTPEQAERMLIDHYKDEENLVFYVRHVRNRSDMAGRGIQIDSAMDDYLAGRYDAATLRLITVLDGFVNDFDKSQRCGLSSRNPDEMVGFDCLGGHYLGLSHAVEVFRKSFHKLVEDEVYEVYRHGIVHGLIVNYNNDVVASKAWNYLFAVCDWADSFERKRQRDEERKKPQKTLAQILKDYQAARESRRRLAKWRAHTDFISEDGVVAEPWGKTEEFISSIQKGNVGYVAKALCRPGDRIGDYIDIAKDYVSCEFDAWQILRVEHPAAARAEAVIEFSYRGERWEERLCWTKIGEDGSPKAEYEEGEWVLLPAMQCFRRPVQGKDRSS